MAEEKTKNLTIMGESSTRGGKFDKVRVMGECEVHGNLETESCKVMGECAVDGNMSCGYFRNMGEVTVSGQLAADEMRLLGQTTVKEQCSVRKSGIFGELICEKSMSGEEAHVHGMLHVRGNVSLERLDMKGGIFVDGLLNCGTIEILMKFDADNYVHEIGTESISVKKKHSIFNHGSLINFQVDTIEGDDIDLEYTTARVVRGARVSIGTGCKIDRVEYSEQYTLQKHAEVGRAVKVLAVKKEK
ncbi:hypothetical protein [Sporolactobacillus pectinivorans]|uniref:hypothetical protein n=1 Tax=Sporolactobacillus pectinivorans TaxID=1591408 RepID=UPI000C26A9A8|nr:hypothetical protein [Sporolactobacillus pectinivorans]